MSEENLVQIYAVNQKVKAELVKGYLEQNEIEAEIKIDASRGVYGNFGGDSPLVGWEVHVPEKDVEQAKELLKDFQKVETEN